MFHVFFNMSDLIYPIKKQQKNTSVMTKLLNYTASDSKSSGFLVFFMIQGINVIFCAIRTTKTVNVEFVM